MSYLREDYSVSVVIPFFNGSPFVARALRSIVSQDYRNIEIVIVDDGSSAGEAAYLKSIQQQFNFLLISQVNGGQSAARNLGVKHASGVLICFLDQDDWFLPNHVSDLVTAFANSRNQPLVQGKFSRYASPDEVSPFGNSKGREARMRFRNQAELFRSNLMIVPSCMLISRKVFDALGGFDEALRGYEDDDLVIRAVLSGTSVIEVPWVVSVWTRNPASSSNSKDMLLSQRKFFVKWQHYFEMNYIDSLSHKKFISRFSLVAGSQMLNSSYSNLSSFQEATQFAKVVMTGAEKKLYKVSEIPELFALKFLLRQRVGMVRVLAKVILPFRFLAKKS